MLHPPSIIAIDDNRDELTAIVAALHSLDYACLPILVNGTKPTTKTRLSGVKLVFFDINYLPGTPNPTLIYETAAAVLSKILAPDNGPYVLVTWTSKSDEHKSLMEYFADKVPEIPTPAFSASLEKSQFTVGTAAQAKLPKEIKNALDSSPQVAALLHWDRACRGASASVIKSILDLLDRKNCFSGDIREELRKVLARMATVAVGKNNVDGDRLAAINEALAPILFDRLTHHSGSKEDKAIWKKAFELADADKFDTARAARLNGLSHIATSPAAPGDRGAVFELAGDTGAKLATAAGIGEEALVAEFIQQKGGKGVPALAESMKKCRWVLVGTRAVCDQAQARGHLRPAVLALEVPCDLLKSALKPREHGAKFCTPAFAIDENGGGEARQLIVNWHWATALKKTELKKAKNLYRLREALINQICAAQAGYMSRPGIVTFDE